jgi:hypothetical protein
LHRKSRRPLQLPFAKTSFQLHHCVAKPDISFFGDFTFTVTGLLGLGQLVRSFGDNFHRTDLLSMGDPLLTPEGNGF